MLSFPDTLQVLLVGFAFMVWRMVAESKVLGITKHA